MSAWFVVFICRSVFLQVSKIEEKIKILSVDKNKLLSVALKFTVYFLYEVFEAMDSKVIQTIFYLTNLHAMYNCYVLK